MPRKFSNPLPPIQTGTKSPGERIAILRKAQGYTQTELGQKIGITQALVSDYERGKVGLSADMLTRIALALDTSTDALLGLDQKQGAGRVMGKRVQRILDRLEALPHKKQKTVIENIELLLKALES